MRKNKFTLIEIITIITILAILLSIIIMTYESFKKKSIYSAVSSNTRIIQTAIDEYYLKNNNYPTKEQSTISNPQLIDTKLLVENGYLKKDLDTSKITSQLYWVDVFGTVWGSTEMPPKNVTEIESNDGRHISFDLEGDFESYNIYEVSNYKIVHKGSEEHIKTKYNRNTSLAGSTSYRLIKSEKVSGNNHLISFKASSSNSIYLVSTVDQYGLESVPKGLEAEQPFEPLLKYEGVTEFEIEGLKDMYWVNFLTIQDTPGDSSISYRFKVKNEEGNYGEYVADFYSLQKSKGITVEVTMKGDSKGNLPSLYDLRVIYSFNEENKIKTNHMPPMVFPPMREESEFPKVDGNLNVAGVEINKSITIGTIAGNYSGDSYGSVLEKDINQQIVETTNPAGEKITVVGGKIDVEELSGNKVYTNSKEAVASSTCPSPTITTNVLGNGEALDSSKKKTLTYLIQLDEDEQLSYVSTPALSNGSVKGIYLYYSKDGKYIEAKSLHEVESPTCVLISYEVETNVPAGGSLNIYSPPYIQSTHNPKKQNVNFETPLIKDVSEIPYPVIEDPNWVTKNKLAFVAHSQSGNPVQWTGFEKEDTVPENTRILYYFSSLTNSQNWSEPADKIQAIPSSRSAMAMAIIQVKKEVANNASQELPKVSKMKLIHSNGEVFYNSEKPVVTILPKKDNNIGREVISTASNVTWDSWVHDPEGNEIVDMKWTGDTYSKYSKAGTYTVYAEALNSKGIWSEKQAYTFNVLEEQPVAKISNTKPYIQIGQKVNWDKTSIDKSYDPDGDGIVKREWKGIKSEFTAADLGKRILELRVMDSEGNWSDWTSQEIIVYEDLLWVNLDPSATDSNSNTSVILPHGHKVYWLENLEGREVEIEYFNSNQNSIPAQMKILDEQGNELAFTDKDIGLVRSIAETGSGVKKKKIIIPKNADAFYFDYTNSTAKLNIKEISVNLNGNVPTEPTNVRFSVDYNSADFSFEKGAGVDNVVVYVNGKKHITSQSNQFTLKNLANGVEYEIGIQSFNSTSGAGSDIVKTKLKTLEYPVTFLDKGTKPEDSIPIFDRNSETYRTFNTESFNNTILTIQYKLNSKYKDINYNGKAIKITYDSSASYTLSTNSTEKMYYHFLNNKVEESNSITLKSGPNELYLHMSSDFDTLYFRTSTTKSSTLKIIDIQEVDITTSPNQIKNIDFNGDYDKIELTWDQDATVDKVLVYRGNSFIGQKRGNAGQNSYVLPETLLSGNTYEYRFIIMDKNKNIIMQHFDIPFKASTKQRPIYFDGLNNTTNATKSFDGDLGTGTVFKTNFSNKLNININGSSEYLSTNTLAGKKVLIKIKGHSNYTIKMKDKAGKDVAFYLASGSRYIETKSISLTEDVREYTVIIPENAGSFLIGHGSSNQYEFTLYEIIAIDPYSSIEGLENVKFSTNEDGQTIISWNEDARIERVEVFKNNIYIGNTSSNEFLVKQESLEGTVDSYHFIVSDKGSMVKTLVYTYNK